MWLLRMHCNLRPPDVTPVVLGCFWPILYSVSMRIDCYVAATDQKSDIAIRFSDHDFLKQTNNLAIRRRFCAATLTFDI